MCNKCNKVDSSKSFYVTTDADGKMPRLERTRLPSRPYFVYYDNNRPVIVAPYFTQDKVWDYSQNMFLAFHPNAKRYDGTPMPMYKGRFINE